MEILILLGSPRKGGNTDTLAKALKNGATESGANVNVVRLNTLKIRSCQACNGCNDSGKCIILDDMTPLYTQCDAADRIILTSPIYFYGLSAQAKLFGDRMQAQWARRYLLRQRFRPNDGRKGYLIATAATNGKKLFDATILSARYIFDAMECSYGGELLVRNVDERQDVANNPELITQATEFGQKIANGIINEME